jgi:hypothetical protein
LRFGWVVAEVVVAEVVVPEEELAQTRLDSVVRRLLHKQPAPVPPQ